MRAKFLYRFLLAILLVFIIQLNLNVEAYNNYNQNNTEPYTMQVLQKSPSNFEINNGTSLYTGAINTYSDQGKLFAQQHQLIANNTINEINKLGHFLGKARYLNQQFISNLGYQLSSWKQFASYNPVYKPYLNKEIELFNLALQLQLEENVRWALIDSVYIELNNLNRIETSPVNLSLSKSLLYTDLINYYVDLIGFYKSKYNDVVLISTLYHALEENPQNNFPPQMLNQLKPLHNNEYNLAHDLIFNLDANFISVSKISYHANELDEFYHQIDKYTLKEFNNQINYLEKLKPQSNDSPLIVEDVNATELLDSYLNLSIAFKDKLEDKVLAYEIEKTVLAAHYEKELDRLTYAGMLYPGVAYGGLSDWASSSWSVIKTGVKMTAGAPFAVADYVTGKSSEILMEVTDKAQAAYQYGPFSKEYNQYAKTYDKVGETSYVVSIKKTFIDPLSASIKGDDKHGLGQTGASKATGSFKDAEKQIDKVTGSNFATQLGLNVLTFGGYGFAKDYSTLNDANQSTANKVGATVGLVLNLVPVSSIANTTNKVLKKTFKTFTNTVSNSSNKIITAVVNSNLAKSTLGNTMNQVKKHSNQLLNLTNKASQGDEMAKMLLNKASNDLSNAIKQKTIAQTIYNQSQKTLNNTIKNSLISVPGNTIKDGVKTGISSFIKDHSIKEIGTRIGDLYIKTLPNALNSSTPFFGNTIGKAIGTKTIANYLLSSGVNTAFNQQIANTANSLTQNLTATPANNLANNVNAFTNNTAGAITTPAVPQQQQNIVPMAPNNQQQNNVQNSLTQNQPPMINNMQQQPFPNQFNPNVAQYLNSQDPTINKVNTHIMKVLTQNQQQLQQQKIQQQQQQQQHANQNPVVTQNFNTDMTNSNIKKFTVPATPVQNNTQPPVNTNIVNSSPTIPTSVPGTNTVTPPVNTNIANSVPSVPASTPAANPSNNQNQQQTSSNQSQKPADCGQTGRMFDCRCNPNLYLCKGGNSGSSSGGAAYQGQATQQSQQQTQASIPNEKYKHPTCNPNYLYEMWALPYGFNINKPPPVSVPKKIMNCDLEGKNCNGYRTEKTPYEKWVEEKQGYEKMLADCKAKGFYHEEAIGPAYKAKVKATGGQY